MSLFGPWVERPLAIAVGRELMAVAGRRDAETERSPEHRAKPEAPDQRSEGSAESDV